MHTRYENFCGKSSVTVQTLQKCPARLPYAEVYLIFSVKSWLIALSYRGVRMFFWRWAYHNLWVPGRPNSRIDKSRGEGYRPRPYLTQVAWSDLASI
jgi:hypothetical protein